MVISMTTSELEYRADRVVSAIRASFKPLYHQRDETLGIEYRGSRGGLLKQSNFYLVNGKQYEYPINLNLIPESILPRWDGTNYGEDYAFVYILTNMGVPIYVGETLCLARRIGQHSSRNFDSVRILKLPKKHGHPIGYEGAMQHILFAGKYDKYIKETNGFGVPYFV